MRRTTLLLISLFGARQAAAQTIRGAVVLPDSVSPVPGVLVVGLDAAGKQAARTLTAANGSFALRLPAAGTYRLQVLRIGYSPMTGPALTVGTEQIDAPKIIYAGSAVALSTVNVRERQTCRVTADTGLGIARVWDEARKAMLISQTATAESPLTAEWIEYDRSLDSAARIVRSQRVHTTRAPTTHAFRAVPLAQLDTGGYVSADASGVSYYAPDAAVLLSDTFIGGHCFRLDDSRRGDGLLGLRFEPAPERRDKREIIGTMWLDRTSAELRNVEFGYTNLPDVALPVAGGNVEFMRLPEGSWLVRRWRLTMPRVERAPTRSGDALRRTIYTANGLRIAAVQVAGGEVTQVQRGDSVLFVGVGPAVRLQLLGRDADVSGAGASVRLAGTDYVGTADSLGRVALTPVLAGRYRAEVLAPMMEAARMPASAYEVEARVGARVDTLRLPAGREVLVNVCPKDSIRAEEGMLHGRVRDEHGKPVPFAAVTATWQENFAVVPMGERLDGVKYATRQAATLSDDAGRWVTCGIPRERLVEVEVVGDSGTDRRRTRLDPARSFLEVDLVLHPATSAAARDVQTALGTADRPRALVELTVTSTQGQVLPGTTLDVADASGMRRTVTTGPGGRALVAGLAPGEVSVLTRKIGFAPGKIAVQTVAGRNVVPIVLNESAAPMLDTVRVVGARALYGLQRNDEFEQRRAMKLATLSYNRDDIRKRNPTDISDMLRGVPSIELRATDKYGGMVAMSSRSMNMTPDGKLKNCYMAVMVDGVIKNPDGEGFDLRQLPPPEDIHGVEVFAGGASIPIQYNGVGKDKWCGMIAVWTR